jgi:hypothetical protein
MWWVRCFFWVGPQILVVFCWIRCFLVGPKYFVVFFKMKREAGGQGEFSGEFSVGLAARRDVASQPAT